ncbi:hypothetical protein FRC19_009499, partial [Serendipita sp. 401]
MDKLKKYKFFGSHSAIPAISNVALAAASPTHARSISQEITNDIPDSHPVDQLDLSLDLSIAGFKTLKEAAEVIPVAGGPLKASCGIIISILQLAKRCKENREGWEKLSDMMKEKNESMLGLLELYSKSPVEYPSAERQAREYQRVLSSIAVDITRETQRKTEASEGLETYWLRMQSGGRETVLASINAEKIVSYQEQLRRVTLDVIEKTVIHQAIATTQGFNDIKAILADKSSSKGPTAMLKPRPRKVKNFVGRTDILDSMCDTHFGNENRPPEDDGPIITVLTGMGGSGKTQIAVSFASLFEKRSSAVEDTEANRLLAKDIAEELGRLPLALAHAAAYILVNDCFDTFLGTYGESRDQFLQSTPDLPQDYPYSVERTIEMSFRCLSAKVQETFTLFAHMDARSIARCVIERAAERKFLHVPFLGELPPQTDTFLQAKILQDLFCPRGEWRSFEFDGMIGECLKYSLLQVSTTDGEKFYSMHPLVQAYIRSNSSTVCDYSARRLVIRLLGSATTLGRGYEFFGFNRLLSPHVRSIRFEEVVEAGDHLGFGAIFSEEGDRLGITHLEECVEIWKLSLGDNVQTTLEAMVWLSNSYESLGRAQDALPLRKEVFQKRTQLLGPGHLDTLMAMNNLANSYFSLGRAQEALPLQEEALEKWRRLLGPDHFNTLMAMMNLANSYRSLGRGQDALPLQEEVLRKLRQFLGPDHINTLMAMNNLANNYRSLGRGQEALPMAEEVFEKRKRLLGIDHRETLDA